MGGKQLTVAGLKAAFWKMFGRRVHNLCTSIRIILAKNSNLVPPRHKFHFCLGAYLCSCVQPLWYFGTNAWERNCCQEFCVQTGRNQVDRKTFRTSCSYYRRPESSYGFL